MVRNRDGNESVMTKPKSKATPRKIGRPTKFTPEVRERILIAIRAGNYIDTAAQSAGISKDTFYSWMTKGETPGAPKEYSDFTDAVKKARAEAEVNAVAIIQQAANRGNWRAAAWYLEKSFPDRYGRTRTDTSVATEDPIQTNAAVIDALDEKIALSKERSRGIFETYTASVVFEAEGSEEVASDVEIPAEFRVTEQIAQVTVEESPATSPPPQKPRSLRHRTPAPIIRPKPNRHRFPSAYIRNI